MSDYTDKCKTCFCRIVCKEDVSTDDFSCEIAHEALEAKFKSDNTQSAAIAKIAAEMERTVDSRKGKVNSVWYVDISKWARQLRAL